MKLPVVSVDIVLKQGEVGILQEPSILYEKRAYRIYGGGERAWWNLCWRRCPGVSSTLKTNRSGKTYSHTSKVGF